MPAFPPPPSPSILFWAPKQLLGSPHNHLHERSITYSLSHGALQPRCCPQRLWAGLLITAAHHRLPASSSSLRAMSGVYWVAGAALGLAEGYAYALEQLCPGGSRITRFVGLPALKKVRALAPARGGAWLGLPCCGAWLGISRKRRGRRGLPAARMRPALWRQTPQLSRGPNQLQTRHPARRSTTGRRPGRRQRPAGGHDQRAGHPGRLSQLAARELPARGARLGRGRPRR